MLGCKAKGEWRHRISCINLQEKSEVGLLRKNCYFFVDLLYLAIKDQLRQTRDGLFTALKYGELGLLISARKIGLPMSLRITGSVKH